MSDLQHQNDDLIILQAADEAIVLYPVAPKSGQVAAQGLTETSWIFCPDEALTKIAENCLLNLGVQFP